MAIHQTIFVLELSTTVAQQQQWHSNNRGATTTVAQQQPWHNNNRGTTTTTSNGAARKRKKERG